MLNTSPLSLYKGSYAAIKEKIPDIVDGQLFFATDTKQIYLDSGIERIKFGGSTGIWYGHKEDTGDIEQIIFNLKDLEEAEDYPSPKDLILNDNGSFFKVVSVAPEQDSIIALRLTVSGLGGGGGLSGYIKYNRVGSKNRFFSPQSDTMDLTFVGESTTGYASLQATVYLVNVAGVKYKLGVFEDLPQSMDETKPIVIDIKNALEIYGYNLNSNYNIEVLLEDSAGNTAANTISYTVTVFDIYVEKIIGIGATYNDASFYCKPVFYSGLTNVVLHSKAIHSVYHTIAEETAQKIDRSGEQAIVDVHIASKDYPIGPYKLEVWLTALAEGTEVKSEILNSAFIVTSQDSSDPQIIMIEPTKQDYKQYEAVDLEYLIAYGQNTIDVIQEVSYEDPETGIVTVTESELKQTTGKELTWSYRFMKLGIYSFTVYAGTNRTVKAVSKTYKIKETSGNVPTYMETGLAFGLIANKTNESKDAQEWKSTGTNVVSAEFDQFNWISNGWKTDETGTSLYLNNGANVSFPYYPFSNTVTNTGLTIELDVAISNVKDRKKDIISWSSTSKDGILYSGIKVNGDFFTINGSNTQPIKEYETNGVISLQSAGMTSTYVHGKRVRITWVIAPKTYNSTTIAQNMVYTYVNGVMSGFVNYGANTFGKASTASDISNKLVIDSTYADVNVYGVRVYAMPLTDRAILSNYFASFADFEEAASRWEDNNLLNDDNRISAELVIKMGNDPAKKDRAIPYILMRGGCGVTDKKGKTFNYDGANNTLTTRLPIGKKDFRLIDMCFIDPADPSRNIGSLASADRVEATIYAQGTSSMDYPIKNLRMYFARDNVDYEYQLFENVPPVNLFCHKVDYMESSSSHNTGLGNVMNDLYGSIKPPSRLIQDTYIVETKDEEGNVISTETKNYDYVTAIKGRPIVIFFKEDLTDPRDLRAKDENDYTGYKFIGRYNFNLDKSTHEPFGFYSDIDRHYGVAIQNPPALDDNYADNLKKTTVLEGFHATFDEKPVEGKIYYHKPEDDPAYYWNNTELANEDQWQKHVAYEKVNDGINSIQVWECLNNNLALTHFQTDWYEDEELNPDTQMWQNKHDPDNEEWVTSFESRYPEYEYQEKSDKRELTRLVNWIHETDCSYHIDRKVPALNDDGTEKKDEDGNTIYEIATDYYMWPNEPTLAEIDQIYDGTMETILEPLFPDENGRPQILGTQSDGTRKYKDEYGYVFKSYEYRLAKFKNEFDQYFESDLTMVYYILTEFLLMIDSRAKNMMLCTFTANCLKNDGSSATKWFPIFYDMDTGLGVNNMGQLKFSYKDEDYFSDVFNAEAGYLDQNGNINTSYSALFTNIRLTLYDRIKTVYHKMRNGAFKYSNMINAYNTNQADRWNETYINQDAYIKYVEPLFEKNSPWKVMVDAAQGTRSLNREQYLRRRFLYMDSKYAYTTDNNAFSYRLYSRLVDPKNIFSYEVTTKDAMYWVSAINKDNIIRGERLEENSTKVINPHAPNSSVGEQEFYIYIPENIVSLGNLSNIGIQNWDPYGGSAAGNTLSMKELILSSGNPGWEYGLKTLGRMSNLSIVEKFPLLEKLDVSYWNYLSSLDLQNNKNLKELHAYGTILNNCLFPEGGVLEIVELPSTLTDLKLVGHYDLHTVGYRYYESGWNEKEDHLGEGLNGKFNQEYFDEHVVIKDNAWENLLKLHIEKCPLIDTKFIFKTIWEAGKAENLEVLLPDLSWIIIEEDYIDNLSNGTMIDHIPLLDALVKCNGYNSEQAYSAAGDLITGREYVGGTIKIMNGSYGINEERLYTYYSKYFPNLKFEYENWNENCISAYSFNTYDTNKALIVTDSFKFTSDTLKDDFTFEKLFVNKDSETYISPIEKAPSPEYLFKFMGWNIKDVQIFEQNTYLTSAEPTDAEYTKAYAAAQADAEKTLWIKYDEKTDTYSWVDEEHTFEKAYETFNTQTIEIYPVYVAEIRSYTASFYDGVVTEETDNMYGTLIETQSIRYNRKATVPKLIPVKMILEAEFVTQVYPFVRFGEKGEDFAVLRDTVFVAQYEEFPEDIRQHPTDSSWFSINGGILSIAPNYPYDAICVPTSVNSIDVTALGNLKTTSKIKRVYFKDDNKIETIGANCLEQNELLEYVDLNALTNLKKIERNAFSYCINATFTELKEGLLSIDVFAFSNCSKLSFSSLPKTLKALSSSAFSACPGIKEIDLSQCNELQAIPEYGFAYCTNLSLKNNELSNSLIEIGTSAFREATQNFIIDFSENTSIKIIRDYAFYRSRSSTNAEINELPINLEEIGTQAFALTGESGSINIVAMPQKISSIGSSAFKNRSFTNNIIDFSHCLIPEEGDTFKGLSNESFQSDSFEGVKNVTDIYFNPALQDELIIPENVWGAGSDVQVHFEILGS